MAIRRCGDTYIQQQAPILDRSVPVLPGVASATESGEEERVWEERGGKRQVCAVIDRSYLSVPRGGALAQTPAWTLPRA